MTALYKELKEIIDPEHTVLVVWDVQNALVDNIFNRNEFIGNLKSLIYEAKKKGIRVFYTKITPMPAGYESGFRTYTMMKRYGVNDPKKIRFMEPGSREAEICSDVKPESDDIIINKNTADIFVGTNFDLMMRNAGIDTVIFTGIATEIGVESSARSASNRGFYPVVAEDCVSSSNREMHESSLKIMRSQLIVAKSDEIISCWK